MNSILVAEPSLCSRAMLCSLSISMWSARKHDRKASEEIAQRHGAQPGAGRYHKVLLPKAASKSRFFATLRRKSRHSRESGNPPPPGDLDPRLRGGDEGLTFISMGGP
jgi:hypothetical protein